MTQLIFYKGKYGTIWDKFICFMTKSEYSHVELRFSDGKCWSSSTYDNGVRSKYINIATGHWDVIPIDSDVTEELFVQERGKKYDYLGLIGTIINTSIFSSKNKWFCSEIVAEALEIEDSWKQTPESLYRKFK